LPATPARQSQGTSTWDSRDERQGSVLSKIGLLIATLVGWLADLLVGGQVSWYIILVVGWSVGLLVG
jgi:hypothetical protein